MLKITLSAVNRCSEFINWLCYWTDILSTVQNILIQA